MGGYKYVYEKKRRKKRKRKRQILKAVKSPQILADTQRERKGW
jgi:translation initiation factor IF-3